MLAEMAMALRKETRECIDFIAKEELYTCGITSVSVEEFERAKKLAILVNHCMDYMVEEAIVLDEIKGKLEIR